ncbi:Ada metal-binding domain-containing protein [Rhizobium rosettiformans]|uniref:Ada metal-binding domain-containing protein n=1 Tax=Rhizobium rosettiformans TaxID=1368430 RepID=A0ABX7EWL1_9HYPH|nr:Ada metal-binding domain-containing protein [Rhizobium rosettiformans]QRF52253.1 Ada metal-binding domain-containing protein [Rhizobium rosettiformans]
MNPDQTDDARWQAVRTRDASMDGHFVYGVLSTRIFCRPSCPSRPARPENVTFHETAEAARAGGFRACLRCCPDQPETWAEQVPRSLTPGRSR